MKKSALLKECTHHEIALLGVPEMYRVKLAFLAGFRFALEPAAKAVVRASRFGSEHEQAQFVLREITAAGTEIYDEIECNFGTKAADRFMQATRHLHTVDEFKSKPSAEQPRPSKSTAPAKSAPANSSSPSPSVEAQRPGSNAEPQSKTSEPCNCPRCQIMRTVASLFGGTVIPA